jgi:hypothetical protein
LYYTYLKWNVTLNNTDSLEKNVTFITTIHGEGGMDLHVRLCNADLFRKRVVNMGIKLYKKLPYHIKTGHDKIFSEN